MIMMERYIILLESMSGVQEAYQWLSEQNVVEEQKIETAQIAGWLGLNSKEMWDTFLPELDQRYKDQASAIVGDSMVRQIRKHGQCGIRERKRCYSFEEQRISSCDLKQL